MPKYPKNATLKQIAALDGEYIKRCAVALRESRKGRFEIANESTGVNDNNAETINNRDCCCFNCLKLRPEDQVLPMLTDAGLETEADTEYESEPTLT